MSLSWPGLAIALILLGILLWMLASGRRRESGVPAGDIIYADRQTWQRQEKPLFARRLGLTGRPDFLVRETDGSIVPVELKSGMAPASPHEGHVMQLAAYCALVHEVFGQRPAYGILQYRDRAFAVDYSPALEEDLLYLLEEMQEAAVGTAPDRDHDLWQRCAACGQRPSCDQALA